ncbi:glycosyltransferase family 4 protein, partial [Candidatus Falkowbacteria bacterium]|nr:glycosyltransferase family 4 protein [Candidatus Falkowbacteria bacterium]
SEQGIKVTVFSYSTNAGQTYEEDGITVIRTHVKNGSLWRWYLAVDIFLKNNRFTVIEDADYQGSAWLYQLLHRRKEDYIHLRLHTCTKLIARFEGGTTLLKEAKVAAMNLIERYNAKKANLISAPSIAIADLTAALWKIENDQIAYLPLPFRINTAEPATSVNGGDYLLYFGRIQQRKGADVFLKMIAKDFLKDSGLKLKLIGNDICSFEKKLKQINNQTAQSVIIESRVYDRESIIPDISRAKVIILPSHFESFGLTALEALWFNPKTFVLSNSGPREVMTALQLESNLLDEASLVDNPEYIWGKINQAVPELTEIRQRINDNFGYQKIAGQLKAILESRGISIT